MKWIQIGWIYLLVACWIMMPGFAPAHLVGGESSDLWNTLWGVDFVWSKLLAGEIPYETDQLNVPNGGTIWIADYLGALTMGPLLSMLGTDTGYQLWLIINAVLLGLSAHGFALDLGAERRAWIAGLGCMFSGSFVSALQNGASESIGLFWVVISVWMIWRAHQEKTSWWLTIAIAVLGGLSSWYATLMIGIFWLSFLIPFRVRALVALCTWCVLLLPWALLSSSLSRGQDGLVNIKTPMILQHLRRSIGPADPWSYLAPYPFQSPDFSIFWRFGDDYVHSSYVGWVVIVCVLLGWRRIHKQGPLWRAMLICFLLSLGPVLIVDGQAFLFGEDWFGYALGVPLPYFVLESLWGFSELSLLYRISFGVVLSLSLLASVGIPKKTEWIAGAVVLMMLELWLWSPVRDFPQSSRIPKSEGFTLLSTQQKGVVLNHPVEKGTPYLFEQTLHRQHLTVSVNMEDSVLGRKLWYSIEKNGCSGVRYTRPVYIVHHPRIEHRPQREDRLVEKAMEECPVLYRDEDVIIVELK